MVQHRNILLATTALNGNDLLDGFTVTPGYPGFASNVILPSFADEFFLSFPNGTTKPWKVPAGPYFHISIPINTTLGVRVGNGSVAIRPFYADGLLV